MMATRSCVRHGRPPLEDEAHVLAAEPEGVREGRAYLGGARRDRQAVEGHLGIQVLEARGGRQQAVLERQDGRDGLHAPRRGHGVAHEQLGGADQRSALAEDPSQGQRLRAIVLRGAGAVGVDIAHRVRL